jgi:signal peptide peptidase SppA
MTTHHFLAWCASTPWAMHPAAMQAYASILARGYARRDGFKVAVAGEAPAGILAAGPRSSGGRQGSIALIQVFGTIVQRASQLGPCEGGTGTVDISNALTAAMNDETISQILVEFDTPGGSVFGVSELGDQIRAASAQKPVVGIANSMAASAGYWLMSQCSECYVTPGGMVGSIGVYTAHEDVSKAMEAEGISVTLISAGKFKTEGNPFGPLDEEAIANTQASVDDYYAMFTKAVAKGRGVPIDSVRNGMGQGRVLGADAALAEKMVDGVMPFGDVVKKMQRSAGPRGRSALAAARNELALIG